MQIHDIIPGLGMPIMTSYVRPPAQTPPKSAANSISILIFSVGIAWQFWILLPSLYNGIGYIYSCLGGISWSFVFQLDLFVIILCLLVANLCLLLPQKIGTDQEQKSEKKNKQKKVAEESPEAGKTKTKNMPKPAWDSDANWAWSAQNWEELAMEAAYKERAQTQDKSGREIKAQGEQKRVDRLYIAVQKLKDIVKVLRMEADRQEKSMEEIMMKKMETEVCDDPTMDEDKEEDEDRDSEDQIFQYRAGYWCRRNCSFQQTRKLSVSPEADEQHEAEDEEYVMVTGDAEL